MRIGRRSLPGQAYLVTFATYRREPLFRTPDVALTASRAITDSRLWEASRLLAWVLMPDHWHGLLELGDRQDLPTLVRNIKANTARAIHARHPAIKDIWMRAYHDRAIRDHDSMVSAARYVVANPLRAGLADSVGNYPFWDAVWIGSGNARAGR